MYSSADTIWILLGSVLVFFMQAGFALLETGFTRAKNAGNIIMKNILNFSISSLVFWFIGFGLMYNGSKGGFTGIPDLFAKSDYSSTYPSPAFLIYQTMFCATAAAIVSGAMAERAKFSSYLIYSAAISALVYPVSGHWIWNSSGWLHQLGFHDFAGSTAVHMLGGLSAFIGAAVLGPRSGKYDKDGKSRAILGHNLILAALGAFILWFGWFGFNGCSTLSATGDDILLKVSRIFLNTNISGVASTVTVMFITWARYGKPDISMTINGILAGLVAITSGCDAVTPPGAFFIGLITAFTMVFSIEFIDHKLKVDDPVGTITVHGVCGALGTILTGIFSQNSGILYTNRFDFFLVQCTGVLATAIWAAVTIGLLFTVLRHTVGIRVSEDEEVQGLDYSEHGLMNSYADFMLPAGNASQYFSNPGTSAAFAPSAVLDASSGKYYDIPEVLRNTDGKIRNVVVLMNPSRFEALMTALDAINITGMTVTNVTGCGIQKGHKEYYRGAVYDTQLLPKLKVEIVISTVPVGLLIKTIRDTLYTGKIGDGKIFIYEVEDVIKVRTGKSGKAALV